MATRIWKASATDGARGKRTGASRQKRTARRAATRCRPKRSKTGSTERAPTPVCFRPMATLAEIRLKGRIECDVGFSGIRFDCGVAAATPPEVHVRSRAAMSERARQKLVDIRRD